MNKFIFLDIDGVLNSEQYYIEKSESERLRELKLEGVIAYGLANIDSKAVSLLNKITDETGAKIVISSCWRGAPSLYTILKLAGITSPIYGETPRLENRWRGMEINKWLEGIKEPYKYVIIDDDNDMLESQLNNFVQTDGKIGLTEENVNEAIKMLNND